MPIIFSILISCYQGEEMPLEALEGKIELTSEERERLLELRKERDREYQIMLSETIGFDWDNTVTVFHNEIQTDTRIAENMQFHLAELYAKKIGELGIKGAKKVEILQDEDVILVTSEDDENYVIFIYYNANHQIYMNLRIVNFNTEEILFDEARDIIR